ncbi:hypothetical protein Pcinc_035966 [Petrolisthes cinctipes]|uniref:Charged multivesicular body protein 7 n=1 Tax=Petrolisthes cinctipes TaxID=88211 RepID=A0AAE1BYR2_PETCI|nr:hypothetical protein Pcinc_035966 [Petrolisthes cinctipes]
MCVGKRKERNNNNNNNKDIYRKMNQDRANYLPPEWSDNARMQVLMNKAQPFDRLGQSARHAFWSGVINRWCHAKLCPTFSVQECVAALRRGTMSPRCLPEVLQDMYSQGEIVPYSEFVQGNISRRGESWGSWGTRMFVSTPARYTWSLLKQAMGLSGLGQGDLVNIIVLKELCDQLLNTVHHHFTTTNSTSPTSLLSVAQLYALTGLGSAGGSADTLQLLIDTLVTNGRASIAEHRGTKYVKFAMPGDLAPPEITDIELAEIDLSRAQNEVEEAVRKMNEETEQLKQQARTALKLGSKVEALSLLRRKKRLEKSLTTQLGALENVSICLQQLQHSRLNRQVLGAFQQGVAALKMAMGGKASSESAANTLDELHQVLEECEDVSAIVSGGVVEGQEEEETELQAELDQLLDTQMDQYKEEEEEMEQDLNMKLPDVPTSRPVVYGLPDSDRSPEVL